MNLRELPGKEKVICYHSNPVHDPVVTVSIITYNHEKYIRQCLDSILEQETTFNYEILLGEDNSSDGTRDICIEYAKKYPDKIRLFLHDRANVINIGGRPTGRYNMLFNFSEARGKYLAICEGDDFWTDPTKLQRQVDFLETNKDYALVFHPVRVFFENGEKKNEIFPDKKSGFTIDTLLKWNFIQTNSVMYRMQDDYKDIVIDVMPGDWYLHLYHAQFGKIGFINRVMSAYRRHEGGIWWGSIDNEGFFLKRIFRQHTNLFKEARNMFGNKKRLATKIYETEDNFVKKAVSLNIEDIDFLREVARLTPRVAGEVIHEMHNQKVTAQTRERELWVSLIEARNEAQSLIESSSYRTGNFIIVPMRTAKKLFKIK